MSLEGLSFDQLEPTVRATPAPWGLGELLVEAERELKATRSKEPETIRNLPDEAEELRWFALP